MQTDDLRQQAEALTTELARVMRRVFALPPSGISADLTPLQRRLCGLLREGSLSMSAIGRELGISLSAVTQIADRLERTELVCRVAQDTDRRVRLLQLTPTGSEMVQQRHARRVERVLSVLQALRPEEWEPILQALQRLAEAGQPQEDGIQDTEWTFNSGDFER